MQNGLINNILVKIIQKVDRFPTMSITTYQVQGFNLSSFCQKNTPNSSLKQI